MQAISGCAFNNTFSSIWNLGFFWYAHMDKDFSAGPPRLVERSLLFTHGGLILDHEQQTSRKRRPPPYEVGLRLFFLFPLS